MIDTIRKIYYGDLEHEHRFMFSLICAELIILSFVYFWPAAEVSSAEEVTYFSEETIYVERAIVTQQTTAPAAPPRPSVPVPVPNDEIIEEEIEFPDIDDFFTLLEADGMEGFSPVRGEGEVVGSPDRPPGLLRIVEPTIPEAAKRANVKAQIKVTFLVSNSGEVEDIFISEIRVYDGNSYEVVDRIGYGLMEATLEAATKWRFRPAQDQGRPVKAYVENSFNIGF